MLRVKKRKEKKKLFHDIKCSPIYIFKWANIGLKQALQDVSLRVHKVKEERERRGGGGASRCELCILHITTTAGV